MSNYGPRPLKRRVVSQAFKTHVAVYRAKHNLSLRAFVDASLGGEGYVAVSQFLKGAACPDSQPHRDRLALLAKATGWPKSQAADVAL